LFAAFFSVFVHSFHGNAHITITTETLAGETFRGCNLFNCADKFYSIKFYCIFFISLHIFICGNRIIKTVTTTAYTSSTVVQQISCYKSKFKKEC